MIYDALINVRFFTADENGRVSNIFGNSYACPLFIENEGFDCRIYLNKNKCIKLGVFYILPIKFLYPNLVLHKISVNTEFKLWEGKYIASGRFLEIRDNPISVV